jgi:hypothetical protein
MHVMSTEERTPTDSARRCATVARIAAAVLGGYALATALSVALAGLMPGQRADAVLAATLGSFAVYAAAALWAFAAGSARLAWLGLLLPTALGAAVAWLVTRGIPV